MNVASPQGRYQSMPLFCIAVMFVVLAPVYWQITEHRRAQPPDAYDGYENADLYGYVYPAYSYAYGRMAEGDLPLWNPYQLSGVPLHADPGMGLWQPINIVFLIFPTHQAMAWHAFLSLSLMGFGMALLLRALGAGYAAAAFAGKGAGLSGGLSFSFAELAVAIGVELLQNFGSSLLSITGYGQWHRHQQGGTYQNSSGCELHDVSFRVELRPA